MFLLKGEVEVSSSIWRKRIAALWDRFYFYPAPEPMPRTRMFWIATGLVTLFVLLFSGFFILFLTSRNSAYLTGAEDLGIMDQAIWSLTHGQLFHQTICNIVSDTNCYSIQGISRFAIHFEPILFPVSLFYFVWPSPNTLLVIQTLVVASGAFPAYWLARLRLRNELAAAGIALLYLLYPAQQQATVFDFHAVTFTASLLLFTLYFMYTRRTVWLFVFAILSMACKEEMPVVIAMFGLWSMLFQHRLRTGGALVLLSLAWLGLVFLSFHFFSPTGHSLLTSRYSYLGNSPLAIAKNLLLHARTMLKLHVLDPGHRQYLDLLLAPASYLPLLAPWVLVLAVPSIALNLFSSDPNQYTGLFQYNAEIVPILIFGTIEALVLILWVTQWVIKQYAERRRGSSPAVADELAVGAIHRPVGEGVTDESAVSAINRQVRGSWLRPVLLGVLTVLLLLNIIRLDNTMGVLPYSQGFTWPHVTPHDELAQRFIDMIPPTASVSAQSNLVPHISHRTDIYLFPYDDNNADYIFLDVTGYTYPYFSYPYTIEVKKLLLSGKYGVVAAQDGYLLLKRGLPSPGLSPYTSTPYLPDALPNLPDEFCSFVRVSPQQVTNPLQVDFTAGKGSLSLIGYSVVAPNTFTATTRYMQVTAYWRVNTPNLPVLQLLAVLIGANGKEEYISNDFPALGWCPTNTWKPGTVLMTSSRTLFLGNVPTGLAHVAIGLLPLSVPFGTIMAEKDRLPLQIVSAPSTVTRAQNSNAVQLETIRIAA